jgi:hypothetical protein
LLSWGVNITQTTYANPTSVVKVYRQSGREAEGSGVSAIKLLFYLAEDLAKIRGFFYRQAFSAWSIIGLLDQSLLVFEILYSKERLFSGSTTLSITTFPLATFRIKINKSRHSA